MGDARGEDARHGTTQSADFVPDCKTFGSWPDAGGTCQETRGIQSFVARLESGQRRVDVIEFFEFAEILGFDPFEVLRAITKIR